MENELKTINSECTTLEKVISAFNAQIFEKLKSAAKTTSNEVRWKMVVVETDALKRSVMKRKTSWLYLERGQRNSKIKKTTLMCTMLNN